MNIDFDSLRDPDAPIPGDRQRAGVNQRARQLRARSRMNRLALSSVSVVAVVALVFGIVASRRDNGPKLTVAGPSGTAPSSIANRFVPPTSVENGIVTLPVTLPDGETTTLTYPQALRIAQLGFAGSIGVGWPVATGDPHCCGRVVNITYDTIEHVYGKGATPIKVYRGANGENVPFFHSPTNAGLDYLVFQFGPWLVQVYDVARTGDHEIRMTDEQRATWARSLTGTVDDNGYLVLHAAAPLSIGDDFDGLFGGPVARTDQVELAAHLYCTGPTADTSAHRRSVNDDGTHGVAWCVGDDLWVSANGARGFVDLADQSLQVSKLSGPTATNTTTTTTPLNPSTFKAFSASFVSPEHGWALTNGAVEETTDGGRTWQRVGSMGERFHGRIRMADTTHGFAFTDTQLMETTDGGRAWGLVNAPFAQVYDLAVSRGTVYVVTFEKTGQPAFRIWSARVGNTLLWTEAPIAIPPGAGPVPTVQLVFSGDRGWLVQVDRVVVNGAQMASDGTWTAWTPPCANAGGAAFLAASSPTDLVASCEEGTFTGPRVTHAIYFSHDGGQSFTRHDAPNSGPVATPSATTAVVPGSAGVERTTDGGATWNGVFDAPLNAVDLGFTTPTQGFIVLSAGDMLMTYDAGASWQKVTLP